MIAEKAKNTQNCQKGRENVRKLQNNLPRKANGDSMRSTTKYIGKTFLQKHGAESKQTKVQEGLMESAYGT